jgi:hypothetical protein
VWIELQRLINLEVLFRKKVLVGARAFLRFYWCFLRVVLENRSVGCGFFVVTLW